MIKYSKYFKYFERRKMMLHSILIIGQSNMAGRGFKEEVDPIVNERISIMRNGLWRTMYTPINADRVTAGVNLVETFADMYVKEHNVDVGIIPCADGGTCLSQWQVGGLLFDHTCYMAELALRTSNIVAVLWHQGESDCNEEDCHTYKEKLSVIFEGFRNRLKLNDVPFLVGGLGDFLGEYFGNNCFEHINNALKQYAEENDKTAFVSAQGLGSNPDKLHFSAQALREFGVRYYNEFIKIEDKNKVYEEKSTPDMAIRTSIEHL